MTATLSNYTSKLNQQQLLFDATPLAGQIDSMAVPGSFVESGYVVLNDIPTETEAIETAYGIINGLQKQPLFYSDYLPDIQLSKGDLIPICEPFVQGGFQALHFDYGLPLVPVTQHQYQNFELFAVLYCPLAGSSACNAETRILSLARLKGINLGASSELEKRIFNYVDQYGDGWKEPEPFNTKRISIFSRILDACLGEDRFISYIDVHSQNFFMPQPGDTNAVSPDEQMQMEIDYYKKAGINLPVVEERVVLKPGQLLLIDNMRVVHGRIGFRKPREVWQFLFSLKHAPAELIHRTRAYLCDVLS